MVLIGIIFVRAAAVIRDIVHIFRQEKTQTEARQEGYSRIFTYVYRGKNTPVCIYPPFGIKVEQALKIYCPYRKLSLNDDSVFGFSHRDIICSGKRTVISGFFPFVADITVIIGRRAPNIILSRSVYDWHIKCNKLIKNSRELIENIPEVITDYSYFFFGFV